MYKPSECSVKQYIQTISSSDIAFLHSIDENILSTGNTSDNVSIAPILTA